MPTCEWFAKCDNDADKDVEHPTVGWVPTCDEHIAWLGDSSGGPKWVPPIVAARLKGSRLAALLAGGDDDGT